MTKKKVPKAAKPTPTEQEDTRAALMSAAKTLFSRKGFDGTTVKDISDQAGVNISLISYHFKGKEGLYKACLEQFGQNRLEAAQRMLQPAQTMEEFKLRIELFIEDLIIWFQQEPDLCQMVQREADLKLPVAEDVFERTFLKVYTTFFAFIKAGQQKKFLRPDLDAQIVASTIFGGLVSMIQKQDLTEKYFGNSIKDSNFRKKIKTQIVLLMLEGLQNQEKTK